MNNATFELAKRLINNLIDHEGAEGFSDSTRELLAEWDKHIAPGEKLPRDMFCDGLIDMCRKANRPELNVKMIDEVLRPYLRILDEDATGYRTDDAGDAVTGTVATMLVNLIARIIPRNDPAAAIDLAQALVNSVSASLSADIVETYENKPTASIIGLDGNKLN